MLKKLRGNTLNTPEADNRLGRWIQSRVAQSPGILRPQLIAEAVQALATKENSIETAISTCLIDARIYPYDTPEGRKYYPYTEEWVQHTVFKWHGKLDPSQQASSPWVKRRHSATGYESTKTRLQELDRIQGIISTMRQMAREGQHLSRMSIAQRSGCRPDAFSYSPALKSLLSEIDDLQRLAYSLPQYQWAIKDLIVAILEDDQAKARQYYSLLGMRRGA